MKDNKQVIDLLVPFKVELRKEEFILAKERFNMKETQEELYAKFFHLLCSSKCALCGTSLYILSFLKWFLINSFFQ